jgi:DNA-binding Xre family transcriptional regulator
MKNLQYEIKLATLNRIARTLGVTTADLIEDVPEE